MEMSKIETHVQSYIKNISFRKLIRGNEMLMMRENDPLKTRNVSLEAVQAILS